jgi:hypothetical protein
MRSVTFLVAIIAFGCGGDDSNAPNPAFPDAAGVYNITGNFDGYPESQASFTGTVTLTQATRTQGTLGGSASITATLGSDVLTGTDDALSQASVASNGAITFTMVDPSGTWTFNGTLSGNSINQGRHTLNAPGTGSISGSWTGTRTTSSSSAMSIRGTAAGLSGIVGALGR